MRIALDLVRHKATAIVLATVAVMALSAPVFAGSSTAPDGLTILNPNDPSLPVTFGELMAPIQPLIAHGVGSTTSIDQAGIGNSATSGIIGSDDLEMVQQSGRNNQSMQAINGDSSALLLVQGGSDNTVAQVANGDRDFQLVGVSGEHNQVAYVQVGNDLAGALDVSNSYNTTVLAFQTPQSGKYLMPTGISGLQNRTVIVVPGRMYVLPKK